MFTKMVRRLLASLLVVSASIAGVSIASADDYPNKPVTFVLPNGAGGAADINLRILVNHMQENVPARLTVQNITGGATATGTRAAIDADPDGYTMLFFHEAFMGTAAQGILGREFTDMVPVARAGAIDIMYGASRDAPFNNLAEMVEYAKANPGKVRVGVFLRAHSHMVALAVMDAFDIDLQLINIPGGGGPIRAALVGGQIDMGITTVAEADSYFESGDIKPLFVFRPVDVPGLEDLPSAEELGHPELARVGSVTNYFWAHKEVPEEIRTYWADQVEAAMKDEGLRKELGERIVDLDFMRGEELEQAVAARYQGVVEVVEQFGLKTEANE